MIETWNKLRQFEKDVSRWQADANDHGIWLFLGAIGCLGVPQTGLRFAAFILLGIFYVGLAIKALVALHALQVRLEVIGEEVIDGSEDALYAERLKDEHLSVGHLWSGCWIAILCLLFYCYAAVVVVREEPNKALEPTSASVR